MRAAFKLTFYVVTIARLPLVFVVAGVVIFDAILKLVFRVVLYQVIYNSSKHIIII